MKKHLFIQEVLMELQNYMHIGLRLIIEKHLIFLHVMGYFLIMKVQEEARHLLQKKL